MGPDPRYASRLPAGSQESKQDLTNLRTIRLKLHVDPVEQIARFLARLDLEGHHVAVRRAKLHHATQIARQPVQHGGRAISDYLLFIEMVKQSQSLRTGQVQSAPLLREIRVRD